MATDRVFACRANSDALAQPPPSTPPIPDHRPPAQLSAKMKDSKFVWLQLQRARTEGRIGILENVSLGRPLRPKGFAHREMALAWVVLTHNLWMLTRLRKSKDQADPLRQAE